MKLLVAFNIKILIVLFISSLLFGCSLLGSFVDSAVFDEDAQIFQNIGKGIDNKILTSEDEKFANERAAKRNCKFANKDGKRKGCHKLIKVDEE